MQNVLLTLFSTSTLLSELPGLTLSERIKTGVKAGAIIGAIPAILTFIINNVQWFILGERLLFYKERGVNAPSINFFTLYAGLGGDFVVVLILILVSAVVGLFAAIIPIRGKATDRG